MNPTVIQRETAVRGSHIQNHPKHRSHQQNNIAPLETISNEFH
jgi:hypothetical protein